MAPIFVEAVRFGRFARAGRVFAAAFGPQPFISAAKIPI
jgi:hypothetical protein